MRGTIQNLVHANENSQRILNFLNTAYPDDSKPDLNVCLKLI